MAYRNGTYVAFHAGGTSDPTASDMKYYTMLLAWGENENIDFEMINSHEKTSAVRDTSKRETLRAKLVTRLKNSKHMVLIIGAKTRFDTDWVPFEIEYAVDTCRIPIIAAYTGRKSILNPSNFRSLWPSALAVRIDDRTAKVIHVPFKKDPILAAIRRFSPNELPSSSLLFWNKESHRRWGLLA